VLTRPVQNSSNPVKKIDPVSKKGSQADSQAGTGLDRFVSEPTTAEYLAQNNTPLDSLWDSEAGHTNIAANGFANAPALDTDPSSIGSQSNFARSQDRSSAAPAQVSADQVHANEELLNRLVTAIEDLQQGGTGSKDRLVALTQEVVLSLREQGISPSVTADSQGRLYKDFRLSELPPGIRYDEVVTGIVNGKNPDDPQNVRVRVFIHKQASYHHHCT